MDWTLNIDSYTYIIIVINKPIALKYIVLALKVLTQVQFYTLESCMSFMRVGHDKVRPCPLAIHTQSLPGPNTDILCW